MAVVCELDKWWWCQVGKILTFILFTGVWELCDACHPDSQYFHACVHTFLERDFPLIQAYQAPPDRRRGRVLLEGPTLDDICRKVRDLDLCLEEEAIMCRGLYRLDDYFRLIRSFRSIQEILCGDDKQGLMDFLKYGSCLENFRSSLAGCQDSSLDWPRIWIHIFRLQARTEVCSSLHRQRDCVLDNWYQSRCEDEARGFYNRTFTTWLDSWCNGGGAVNCDFRAVLLVVVFWTCTRLKLLF